MTANDIAREIAGLRGIVPDTVQQVHLIGLVHARFVQVAEGERRKIADELERSGFMEAAELVRQSLR